MDINRILLATPCISENHFENTHVHPSTYWKWIDGEWHWNLAINKWMQLLRLRKIPHTAPTKWFFPIDIWDITHRRRNTLKMRGISLRSHNFQFIYVINVTLSNRMSSWEKLIPFRLTLWFHIIAERALRCFDSLKIIYCNHVRNSKSSRMRTGFGFQSMKAYESPDRLQKKKKEKKFFFQENQTSLLNIYQLKWYIIYLPRTSHSSEHSVSFTN